MSSIGHMFSSGCAAPTRFSVAPRSECSLPIATIVSFQLRPIMSMLGSATMLLIGTGGWSEKYARPRDAYVVHVRAEHDELVLEDRVAARQDAHHVRREPALHDPYPGMHV